MYIGLPSLRLGNLAFNGSAISSAISQLVAAGRKGVLPGTLSGGNFWRDRARTQPYTEADKEQTVEFVDDLTGNPVGWQLGQNLVTNGTFVANLSGWTLSQTVGATLPAWSAGSMRLVSDGSGFSRADQQLTTIPNRNYRLWVFVVTPGSGSCDVRLGTTQGASDILSAQSITATGWQSYPFVPTTSSTWIRFSTGSNNATGYLVDTVVAKEVIRDESWMGPNLVTNGTFDSPAGWTTGAGWSVAGGVAEKTAGTASLITCPITVSASRAFVVEGVVTSYSAGTVTPVFIGGTTASGTGITSAGPFRQLIVANSGNVTFGLSAGATFVGSIDNITVREIPGHPIVSAVAGSGLVLSRRVNMLQRTEAVDHAGWSKSNISVVPNAAVGPTGQTDADRIVAGNGLAQSVCSIVQAATKPSSVAAQYVASISAKADAYNRILLYIHDTASTSNRAAVLVSLTDGSVVGSVTVLGTFSEVTASVSAQPNGFYRVVLRFTCSTESSLTFRVYPQDSVSTNGDGVSGILVWGADLRPGFWDQFQGIPSYQRVGDGTAGVLDYDDSPAFPLHWRNVTGTQAMMTLGTVDMSAGDAGAIIAGLVKTSDTIAILGEFSANANSSAGSAYLATGTTGIQASSRGTAQAVAVGSGVLAPSVVSCILDSDISIDKAIVTVNGTTHIVLSGDQGTGNLGNHRLNIAGRDVGGTASLRFTGILLHLPALVAADAGLDLQRLAKEYAAQSGYIY